MRFYADLHLHSRYSRATSRDCDLEHLSLWAQRKGITVVATGDFTHPAWFAELEEKLVPAEAGLYRLRDDLAREVERRVPPACRGPVRFLLSVEIATIYKKGDRTRKIHHLVYAPDFAAAGAFRRRLGTMGNLASDGRPILGLDSRDLLEVALEAGPGTCLVPAHIWTPWFAVLGSKSGFDAVPECYGDLADHVFAVETGLSSDPAMNWRVSALDRYRLLSSSDAHSPAMLGREACVFDTELGYDALWRAVRTGAGFGGTVEFFPEEGKYHLDGHRACGVRLAPADTRSQGGLCPACGKRVTVGVQHRVEALADQPEGRVPAGAAPFTRLVPLAEIVGEVRGVGATSGAVGADVAGLCEQLGPELAILAELPLADVGRAAAAPLVEALARLRRGEVVRDAGYDGEYGVIRMFAPGELGGARGGGRRRSGLLFAPGPATEPAAAPPRPPAPAAARRGADDALASVTPSGVAAPDQAVARPGADGAAPPLLAGLDPDQRAAAAITRGALLILAGPGTGKTRTLTHRLAHLIRGEGVAPAACLALTFTRRAAEELRERLARLTPPAAEGPLVTTFHGLGLRLITEARAALGLPEGWRIADEPERLALARAAGAASDREAQRLLKLRAVLVRDGGEPPEAPLLGRYVAALRAAGLVDLDDLIDLPARLLAADPALRRRLQERWRFVSIDEYQDIDAAQYRLVRQLVPEDGNLCAIGDPDQAIYGFRGADVGFFLRFTTDYPAARTVQLTRNYRSSPAIVAGALQAIAPATLAPGRRLTPTATAPAAAHVLVHAAPTERAEAELVVHTIEQLLGGWSHFSLDSGRVAAAAEAAPLSFADFAVLYRTEAQVEPLREAFARAGVPFQQRSHDRLLARPEVQALCAALRADCQPPLPGLDAGGVAARIAAACAAADPADAAARAAAAELVAPLAVRCGADAAAFHAALSLGAEVDTWDPRADRVSLLTLHAAKGLEFPVVFIVGCEDGLLPLRFGAVAPAGAALDEERRLFFVGMTRARTHLVLCHARRRSRRGVAAEAAPSPFLADLGAALVARLEAAALPAKTAKAPEQLRLW
ncbi:MAG TPA: UvrD-helicase domain-containing protein [Polyangia bacterium]